MSDTEKSSPKRPRKVGVAYDVESGDFRAFSLESDGSTVHAQLTGNISDFSSAIRAQLELHGLTQKITDEARNGADPADRFRMISERVALLMEGKWAETIRDGLVEKLVNVIRTFSMREGRAFDEAAWRERLSKSASLRQKVLLERPVLYAIYQELYGQPPATEAGEDDPLDF